MSEKRPFDAAIATLENNRCVFNKKAQVEITNAIRILEDWPQIESRLKIAEANAVHFAELIAKWGALIEAAGKVDKALVLNNFSGNPHIELRNEAGNIIGTGWALIDGSESYAQILSLLESLPDKEKEGE